MFDFFGYMWAPILVNFLHMIFIIFGIFGAYQFRSKYLISVSFYLFIYKSNFQRAQTFRFTSRHFVKKRNHHRFVTKATRNLIAFSVSKTNNEQKFIILPTFCGAVKIISYIFKRNSSRSPRLSVVSTEVFRNSENRVSEQPLMILW